MIRRFLLTLCLSTGLLLHAQILKPLAQGIPDEIFATTGTTSLLYTGSTHYFPALKAYQVTVSAWNGSYWIQYPSVFTSDSASFNTLCVFDGCIYVGGRFIPKSPQLQSSRNLIRFNTLLNRWEPAIGFTFQNTAGAVNTSVVYKNELYLGGDFSAITSTDTIKSIMRYDGGVWKKCGSSQSSNTTVITDLEVISDTLFACGAFNALGGISSPSMATFDGTAWRPAYFAVSGTVLKVVTFQNKITALVNDNGGNRVLVRTATGLQNITTSLLISNLKDIEVFNNELWLSGGFAINSVTSTLAHYNTSWVSASLPLIPYNQFQKFNNNLYVTSPYDVAGVVRMNRIAQLLFNGSRISGRFYADMNSNCKYDNNNDKPLSRRMVTISGGSEVLHLQTDSTGFYSGYLAPGTYDITFSPFKNWRTDSPCSISKITLAIAANQTRDSVDFAFKPTTFGPDLKVSITPNRGFNALQNIAESYVVTYTNNGTQDIPNAAIKVIFNKKLTSFNATQGPILNGNEAVWSISNLKVGEQRTLLFSTKALNDSFLVNDKLQFTASSNLLNDLDPSDNMDTVSQLVQTGAASAIQKDLYPSPPPNDSVSLVTASNNEINYLIHFENTSLTDTIKNIVIIDTLDLNTYIQYIQETGSTHLYTTKLYSCPPSLGKGVIVWTFSNINLPPATLSDDVYNRGHIGFKIKFNAGAPVGTLIKNRAYVVFDYLDPLRTNNTYAKISNGSGLPVRFQIPDGTESICVNPASHSIRLLRDFNNYSYRLINASGQVVQQGEVTSKSIDINNLAEGVYMITLQYDEKMITRKIIIQ